MGLRTILLIACLGLSVSAAAEDADRVISGSGALGDARLVALSAKVGSIRVEVGKDDAIAWRVELEAKRNQGWFTSGRHLEEVRKALAGAEVEGAVRGESFRLKLQLPRSVDNGDVTERWTIEVPARFAAELRLGVGRVGVVGIAGGVEAEVDVGHIDIEVPSGEVEASADVGDVEVRIAESSRGSIDLAADVGDVDLELDGRRIRSDSGFGPGESLRMEGDQGPSVRVRTDVGDIEVKIGR